MIDHHLSVMVHKQAAKYGDRTALRYRDYDTSTWISVSWNQFSQIVRRASAALAALGIREQENLGIFSQNMPEWFYIDFASFANRAVSIPFYATSSQSQASYMINDAEIRFLFVGEQYQYDTAFALLTLCPTLERIIIFDPKVKKDERDTTSLYLEEFMALGDDSAMAALVEERTARASADDLANILYTSGTTGVPKGVMLHHSNYIQAFKIHDIRLTGLDDKDVSLSFLPLTHVFEKAWSYYCLHRGIIVCINLRPADIQTTIKEIRPSVMCSVPRFWEKVYIGVQEKINETTGVQKKVMLDAIEVGKRYNLDYIRLGKRPPVWLTLKYKFYKRTIYALLKKTIGIENGKIFPTAGAAVSDVLVEFCKGVGINMVVGYGLTETTASVSCMLPTGYEIGSVGEIMPEVEVKIGENDEVLVRGATVLRGYYRKPEITAQAIDADGWFHTGDAGYLRGNHLYLKERIKDLFKTSNGKYIAPQAIETKISVDRFIDQVAVVADKRKFVSALIVPDREALKKYAAEHNLPVDNWEALLQNPEIIKLYQERIDTLQQEFAHYEQIKRFTLLPKPFSMEKGELTNTLKLRRAVIYENYKEIINAMYPD